MMGNATIPSSIGEVRTNTKNLSLKNAVDIINTEGLYDSLENHDVNKRSSSATESECKYQYHPPSEINRQKHKDF